MSAVAASVRIQPLPGSELTRQILIGKKRIGYAYLSRPGHPEPISWLPLKVGGVKLSTDERIAVVERVRELMAPEWEQYAAAQQRLRDLENGVAEEGTAEAETAAEDTAEGAKKAGK